MSVIVATCCTTLNAQSFEEYRKAYLEQHKQYTQTITNNYNSYRDSLNQQFADFMRNKWVEKSFQAPIPIPVEPKPAVPIVLQPEEEGPSEAVEDVVTSPDTPIIDVPFKGVTNGRALRPSPPLIPTLLPLLRWIICPTTRSRSASSPLCTA